MDPAARARYQRHLSLPEIGPAGQAKLADARVLVVGAGGLGSPAALYLAAAGVGTLGLVDGDRIDVSNLQRQVLYDTPSVGQLKVEVAAQRLRELNPLVHVEPHPFDLAAKNARGVLSSYDIVLDGSDRLSTRYLVNDACVLFRKSLVTAAIHRFEGQAMTYVPGAGPCYRCLYPSNAEGLVANCAEAGVMGVLPGILGTLQAAEAIKLIVGIGRPLTGRLLLFDALEMSLREFGFRRRTDCAVCGETPTITTLATHADNAPPAASPERIKAATLAQWLTQPAAADSEPAPPLTLIDVRAPAEFAVGSLPGAISIPVTQLAQRIDEVPADRPVLFLCRSGGRSLQAARVAAQAGRTQVGDLEGGLLAWARDVDPEFLVADP
jgi:sulfur-carrier protein adenylyltransferase/sulfurtransferase